MADYCSCGSIIFNGGCSNKNCSISKPAKAAAVKSKNTKSSTTTEKKTTTKTRRASKCKTYNLYDLQENENSKKEEND